jgi:aminoglycoside 3-N-acetyltransferase
MTMPEPTSTSFKQRTKKLLKPMYLWGKQYAVGLLRSYSPEQLESALRELGLTNGDNVIIHSAFSRSNGFIGGPGDVIQCALNVIGANGHLLMVSMPYRGSSESYAAQNNTFDVEKTPSAMGVISETFRRQAGVLRSSNPLHPILAFGPKARWLLADHEKSPYSCGKGSPFERFMNIGGKVLFFDVPFSTLTFMHYVEHRFQESLPVKVYEEEYATLRVKEPTGKTFATRQYLFSKEARNRRNFTVVENDLLHRRLLAVKRLGNTRLMMVRTSDVFDCATEIIKKGPGIYTE